MKMKPGKLYEIVNPITVNELFFGNPQVNRHRAEFNVGDIIMFVEYAPTPWKTGRLEKFLYGDKLFCGYMSEGSATGQVVGAELKGHIKEVDY